MGYSLIFMNGASHLPADEGGMVMVNTVALVAMLCYGAYYIYIYIYIYM